LFLQGFYYYTLFLQGFYLLKIEILLYDNIYNNSMASTRIINDIKYLQLANENHLKNTSLEDNVYFTLRDIFANVSGIDYCMEANGFLDQLTNGISFQERTIYFTYTNVLNDKNYIYLLNRWLSYIQKYAFEFEAINDGADTEEKKWYFATSNLFKFDDWWLQFEELKILISQRFDLLYEI
jgi:hypothetical protein